MLSTWGRKEGREREFEVVAFEVMWHHIIGPLLGNQMELLGSTMAHTCWLICLD